MKSSTLVNLTPLLACRLLIIFAVLGLSGPTLASSGQYVISGSPDGTGTFEVDDDLDVYLNGALVYTDGTVAAGTRGPIALSPDQTPVTH